MSRENAPVYDVFVIGAGMAGMAAALFAAARGMTVAMCGSVGGIDFSTGPLDLLSVHPVAAGTVWKSPWQAMDALVRDCPEHPYAKVGSARTREAMDAFCKSLAQMGLPYEGHAEHNTAMLTPAGTIKRTWRVPRSMWQGAVALEEKAPCLIVGFKGLKGFSARQIESVQNPHWPALRSAQLFFPGFRGELYAEHLAQSLADPEVRRALAAVVAPELNGEQFIGFPSSLGLYGGGDAHAHLEEMLGAKVFEIPTLPPSVAGGRLRAAFERYLPQQGVDVYSQKLASQGALLPDGNLRFDVTGLGAAPLQGIPESPVAEFQITARTAIHAGGRFFGKGLQAERTGIREPVLGLYVQQPESRDAWHAKQFFTPEGHAVNRSGLLVDAMFRPLSTAGEVAFANLFAAGSILAGQDWMRQKCGAGLAVSTAWCAVEAAHSLIGGGK